MQAIDSLDQASRGFWKDENDFNDDDDDDDDAVEGGDDGDDDDDDDVSVHSKLDPSMFEYACASEP